MKTLIEFITMSEDAKLKDQAIHFQKIMPDCKIDYLMKGEYRKYSNGKISKFPAKNSVFTVINTDKDYNKVIIDMITVYENLSNYFDQIEHDTFINLSFFSNEMFSLEFSSQALLLLNKHNFSLPISCYYDVNVEVLDTTS
jgi:hypothetical protein